MQTFKGSKMSKFVFARVYEIAVVNEDALMQDLRDAHERGDLTEEVTSMEEALEVVAIAHDVGNQFEGAIVQEMYFDHSYSDAE